MTKQDLGGAFWTKNLDEVDRELARLALACKVRLLDAGVIERVLNNDANVCGSSNPAGFAKLRDLLMMHYAVRNRMVGALGEANTQIIVKDVVAKLRERFGDQLGTASPD
jgi:hypothetical protein